MSKPKHSGHFEIVSRNPNVWLASCGRHFKAVADTYAQAEDEWRKHVHAETGKAPEAWGDTTAAKLWRKRYYTYSA